MSSALTTSRRKPASPSVRSSRSAACARSSGMTPWRSRAASSRLASRSARSSVDLGLLELLAHLLHAADRVLLGLPLGGHRGRLLLEVGELAVERVEARARRVVVLLGQRGALDLQLQDAAVDLVDLDRLGVDLDPQAGGGLVDQVNGLVGQEAVGDVAVAQRRGGDQRGVLDVDLVVQLVALLEPAQDRDRVLDRRLADEHRLEAALQRGVLLDVLAVLVQRRGADGAQLAAGEHRLEQVGGVDGALGGARADDRVQLVHEQDDVAAGLLDLGQDRLQALLELAAVLRAGQQRADVEADRRGGRAATRGRRRRRCAGRGPRRSRSCRRRARRSGPGCSSCGGRGPG